VGSDLAHQLYDELTTLAMHKGNWFSELRQLTLTGDEEERPFLVKCRHAEIALGDVEDSGINIVEGKWHRIACVRKAST
jgi:hypothetical protein